MTRPRGRRIAFGALLGFVLVLAALLVPAGDPGEQRPREPLPTVSRKGDELRAAGRRFIAFGFNYGCGPQLGETLDFFKHPNRACRAQLRRGMSKARKLGANTLRVYLELFAFVKRRKGRLRIRDKALKGLSYLLGEAERQRVYLDLTGNLVWRRSRRWYDAMSARDRWRVQARFWRAIAREGAGSRATLSYELTSEPVVPPSDPGSWYGGQLGSYNFAQYIVRRLGGRDPDRLARRWIRRLSRAIRREDRRHLIGVGLLPFRSGAFRPANVADLLDVLFVHEYPRPGAAADSIDLVREFDNHGRPVILGETAALNCDLRDQEQFLRGARDYLDGYLSFFDGRRPSEVEIESAYDRFYRDNLEQFVNLAPLLLGARSPSVPAGGGLPALGPPGLPGPSPAGAVRPSQPPICDPRFL